MPEPIKTVNELSLHGGLFDPKYPTQDNSSLSEIACIYLGIERTAAKQRFSEETVALLKTIYSHEDELLTATNIVTARGEVNAEDERTFRIPKEISDSEILNLKTQGLIVGSGRAVKFTEAGQIALRDSWLKSSNKLKEERAKSEFVHPWRRAENDGDNNRTASRRKFVRVAAEPEMFSPPGGATPEEVAKTDLGVKRICGYCNKPGGDMLATPLVERLPNVNDPGTKYVHMACESMDDERAENEIRERGGNETLRKVMLAVRSRIKVKE